MSFRFTALPAAPFAALFALPDEELAIRNILRQTVDAHPGYPCRVSLQDAAVGEEVLLLPYTHQAAGTPYRGEGPIYVRRGAVAAAPAVGEVPAFLLHRMLSLRAYDEVGMMVAARTLPGRELAGAVVELLRDERVAYLHVHNSGPGCYNCRVERGGSE